MKKVIKKHPLAIRWFHWINFPVIAIMIWSGMLIYWANDVYRLGWGDKTVLKFFPDSFYKALNIPFRLAEGMSLHFVFMWLFAINGLIYFIYLIFSGEWRLIFPNKKSLKESLLVVLHDLHLRKSMPPQKKYNAAQRIAYTVIIFMGLGSVLTGLSIYKPVQFHGLVSLLGGYEWARAEHFILTILFVLFFLVHIVQVILAGWNNFRSMVTGLDVLTPPAKVLLQTVAIVNTEVVSDQLPGQTKSKMIKEPDEIVDNSIEATKDVRAEHSESNMKTEVNNEVKPADNNSIIKDDDDEIPRDGL